MPKKVATIDLVLSIDGIGTVIALPNEEEWAIGSQERIHRRERIQIRTQSGVCISTFIKDIEMISLRDRRGSVAFSLPSSIKAEDLSEGSQLWLERDGNEPLIEP